MSSNQTSREGAAAPRMRTRSVTVNRLWAGVLGAVCVLAAVSCSTASSSTPAFRDDALLLVPNLNAGAIGWCVIFNQEGSCLTRPADTPIVLQDWVAGAKPSVARGYALTTSAVASVSVNGAALIRTRRDSRLPHGLRAVVVEVPAVPDHEGGQSHYRAPRFLPFDAGGERIKESVQSGSPLASFAVPTESVADATHPAAGLCTLQAAPFSGLKVGGGRVITAAKSYHDPVGGALMACASTSYQVDGWPLLASILLNAAQPGATPPTFPALEAVPGHQGLFKVQGLEGEMLMQRIPGAWLAVTNGQGLQQRLRLLEHLHATVRAR
jgi:hypothetical protein